MKKGILLVNPSNLLCFTLWAQLGLNQRLPDYESGALTN